MSLTSMFFFFSSRRRHTRYWRDWSSDVCSSDLFRELLAHFGGANGFVAHFGDNVGGGGFAGAGGLRHEIEQHAAAKEQDDNSEQDTHAGFARVFCYSHTASSSS